MSEPRATYSASGAMPSPEAPAFTPAPIRYRVWDGERMHDADDVASRYVFCGGEWYADWRDFEDGTAIVGAVALLSTGLHDADGREVFEGGLLLDLLNPEIPPLPVYRDGSCFGTDAVMPLPNDLSRYRQVGHVYEASGARCLARG